MPRDSNWNTAAVLPVLEDVVGARWSSSGSVSRSIVGGGIEHAHVADRPVEDRQRGEAQEVELDEADRLDVVLVELRQDRVGVGLHVQRAEVGELAGRDQHAARVHADVARQALELLRRASSSCAHFLLGGLALVEQRLDLARVDDVGLGLAARGASA